MAKRTGFFFVNTNGSNTKVAKCVVAGGHTIHTPTHPHTNIYMYMVVVVYGDYGDDDYHILDI